MPCLSWWYPRQPSSALFLSLVESLGHGADGRKGGWHKLHHRLQAHKQGAPRKDESVSLHSRQQGTVQGKELFLRRSGHVVDKHTLLVPLQQALCPVSSCHSYTAAPQPTLRTSSPLSISDPSKVTSARNFSATECSEASGLGGGGGGGG